MNRNETAEVLRLLLLCNCIDLDEIISWADSEIVEDENPPYALIELSVLESSHPIDIENKLREIAIGADPFAAIRRALGQIWKRINEGRTVDLDSLTKALETIPPQYDWNLPEDLRILNGIDDFTYLEFVSGKTKQEAELALLAELKVFYSEQGGASNSGGCAPSI